MLENVVSWAMQNKILYGHGRPKRGRTCLGPSLGYAHTNPDIFETGDIFLHEFVFRPHEASKSGH